jgi:hypothetical protein
LEEEKCLMQSPEQKAELPQIAGEAVADGSCGQPSWEEPKLTFLEPRLTIHGRLEEVTAGFFGGFTP